MCHLEIPCVENRFSCLLMNCLRRIWKSQELKGEKVAKKVFAVTIVVRKIVLVQCWRRMKSNHGGEMVV
jgi:hypothetical protein